MKDVNCKNWSHKFFFERRGSQQFCSVGRELPGADSQFRFNPKEARAQERGGVGRERGR